MRRPVVLVSRTSLTKTKHALTGRGPGLSKRWSTGKTYSEVRSHEWVICPGMEGLNAKVIGRRARLWQAWPPYWAQGGSTGENCFAVQCGGWWWRWSLVDKIGWVNARAKTDIYDPRWRQSRILMTMEEGQD